MLQASPTQHAGIVSIEILRQGSQGPAVTRWQNFLISHGHLNDEADGDFGPVTERATKASQRAQRLSPDGMRFEVARLL